MWRFNPNVNAAIANSPSITLEAREAGQEAVAEIPSLPSWVHLVAIDLARMTDSSWRTIDQSFCKKVGWKLTYGRDSLVAHPTKQVSSAQKIKLLDLRKRCGLDLMISSAPENIFQATSNEFDDITSGEGDEFLLVELTPETLDLRVFDLNNHEIYHSLKTR